MFLLNMAQFAVGLPGHVLVKAFSPVFFAREDTATPMHAALLGFVIALVGSLALLPIFGHVGVAIATSVSGWATAGVLGDRAQPRQPQQHGQDDGQQKERAASGDGSHSRSSSF